MKKISVSILLLFLLTACSTHQNVQRRFHDNPVVAHRGAWKNTGHPQNSLASLRAAMEMKCRGSELDVQFTADDSLIVFHDLKTRGMVIDSIKYEDLIREPLPNGEKIPTVREYITEAKKYATGTKLVFDIKTPYHASRTKDIAAATLVLLREMKVEHMAEFLVGDLDALDYLIASTSIPVAYLGRWRNELPEMYPDKILRHKVKYIDYQDVHYKKHLDWIATFRENGVHLNVWTVNKEDDMVWFLEKGFDYITTDEPELLLNLVEKRKKKN